MQVATPITLFAGDSGSSFTTLTPGSFATLASASNCFSMGSSPIGSSTFLSAYISGASLSVTAGRAVIGSVSGLVVTPGASVEFQAYSTGVRVSDVSCTSLSATKGFIAFLKTNTGSGEVTLWGQVITYSGSTISSVATPIQITGIGTVSGGTLDCIALTDTQVLILQNSSTFNIHLVTVSGTSFSVTDSDFISGLATPTLSLRKLSNSRALALYTFSGPGLSFGVQERVISVASNQIVLGDLQQIIAVTSGDVGGLGAIDSTRSIAVFNSSNSFKACVSTVSADTVTGSGAVFEVASGTAGPTSASGVSSSQAVVAYYGVGVFGKIVTIANETITSASSAVQLTATQPVVGAAIDVLPLSSNTVIVTSSSTPGGPIAGVVTLS